MYGLWERRRTRCGTGLAGAAYQEGWREVSARGRGARRRRAARTPLGAAPGPAEGAGGRAIPSERESNERARRGAQRSAEGGDEDGRKLNNNSLLARAVALREAPLPDVSLARGSLKQGLCVASLKAHRHNTSVQRKTAPPGLR